MLIICLFYGFYDKKCFLNAVFDKMLKKKQKYSINYLFKLARHNGEIEHGRADEDAELCFHCSTQTVILEINKILKVGMRST